MVINGITLTKPLLKELLEGIVMVWGKIHSNPKISRMSNLQLLSF